RADHVLQLRELARLPQPNEWGGGVRRREERGDLLRGDGAIERDVQGRQDAAHERQQVWHEDERRLVGEPERLPHLRLVTVRSDAVRLEVPRELREGEGDVRLL